MIRFVPVVLWILCMMGCKEPQVQVPGATPSDFPSKKHIMFPHKSHAASIACNTCHRGKTGKIDLDRDMGHGLCLDCHRQRKTGPVDCSACHAG